MSKTKSSPSISPVPFETQQGWSDWLATHYATSAGVWVKIAKKSAGVPSITYAEALEAALCHGWIDGQKQKIDEDFWMQRFCPRKADSIWSQINRQKALDLIEQGRMLPAGLAAIDTAKANGRWEGAYAGQSKATVPADLQEALGKHPRAAAFFETLKGANRYAILFRLQTAKKAETRAARLTKFVAMLERGETFH